MGYLASAQTCTYVYATGVLLVVRLLTAGVFRKELRRVTAGIPSLFGFFTRDASSETVRHKIHENLWYALWHSWSFAFNAALLAKSGWGSRVLWLGSFETQLLHEDFETFRVGEEAEWFLDVNLAFWTTCAVFLALETIRKDFYQMLVHHVFTIALIAGSNWFRQQRFSLVVLLLHDVVDIFLYLGKVALYKQRKSLCDAFFLVFVLTFFFSRLVAYPLICILPCWRFMLALPFSYMRALPAMLSGLYLLHLFWWRLIVKMVRASLAGPHKSVNKDVRSEDEDDDTSGAADTAPASATAPAPAKGRKSKKH